MTQVEFRLQAGHVRVGQEDHLTRFQTPVESCLDHVPGTSLLGIGEHPRARAIAAVGFLQIESPILAEDQVGGEERGSRVRGWGRSRYALIVRSGKRSTKRLRPLP
jgi:hypothetical protein